MWATRKIICKHFYASLEWSQIMVLNKHKMVCWPYRRIRYYEENDKFKKKKNEVVHRPCAYFMLVGYYIIFLPVERDKMAMDRPVLYLIWYLPGVFTKIIDGIQIFSLSLVVIWFRLSSSLRSWYSSLGSFQVIHSPIWKNIQYQSL